MSSTEAKPGKESAADVVIVGCRHPHGIILKLYDMVDTRESAGNGRFQTIKVARPRRDVVTLKGYADKRVPVAVDGVGMYGTTRDVPARFFAEWLSQNKESPLVTGGIVFAAESEADFKAMAREYRKETTGLEPLDADKPGARFGALKKVEKLSEAQA